MAIEYGLKSFMFKEVGGEALASLGKIADGTTKWNGDKPTLNHFYSAQNPDYPALSVLEKAGIKKIAFSLMELDADVLVRIFGGTATGVAPNKTYVAPRVDSVVYGSCELITETNLKITVPKGCLVPNFNWSIDRKSVSNIDVEITVCLPDLEADMPYTIARVV